MWQGVSQELGLQQQGSRGANTTRGRGGQGHPGRASQGNPVKPIPMALGSSVRYKAHLGSQTPLTGATGDHMGVGDTVRPSTIQQEAEGLQADSGQDPHSRHFPASKDTKAALIAPEPETRPEPQAGLGLRARTAGWGSMLAWWPRATFPITQLLARQQLQEACIPKATRTTDPGAAGSGPTALGHVIHKGWESFRCSGGRPAAGEATLSTSAFLLWHLPPTTS